MNSAQRNNDPLAWLIDGALMDARERRKDLVGRMAKDLVKYDAVHDERDAIRSLFGRGFSMPDIIMLIDDARQVAMAEIVAKEMSKP